MSRFIGAVTKSYHFTLADASQGRREKPHKINLRHNQITGSRYVLLDGLEVPGSRGNTSIMSAVEIAFKVEEEDARITITPALSGGGFSYSCQVGSRVLEELSNVLETEDELVMAPAKIRVPETRTTSSEGKAVVHYKVVTTIAAPSGGGENQEVVVFRRYKEFSRLNNLLRSAFAGSHLLSSLPHLPGKVLNPFTDQTTPQFIEGRRRDLEVYLNRLCGVSKCSKNLDMLKFLGLDPVTGLPLDPADVEKHVEYRF